MNSTDVAALWTAADLTGLSSGTTTLLLAFIGVGLLFVGARYIRKSGVR